LRPMKRGSALGGGKRFSQNQIGDPFSLLSKGYWGPVFRGLVVKLAARAHVKCAWFYTATSTYEHVFIASCWIKRRKHFNVTYISSPVCPYLFLIPPPFCSFLPPCIFKRSEGKLSLCLRKYDDVKTYAGVTYGFTHS
jgi:hypothetical protein